MESKTLLDVQPLLDNYDNLIKEFCTIAINCDNELQMSFDESMEECIRALKEQSQDDQSGSCPDYYKSMQIVLIKCSLDVVDENKTAGKAFCDGSSGSIDGLLDSLESISICAETKYDLSKYEKCH